MKIKTTILLVGLLLCVAVLGAGCGKKDVDTTSEKLPELEFAWGLDLHTAQPFLALNRVEEFKRRGVYLNILSEDKYELIEDGKPLAVISYSLSKSGAETTLLMGQGHVDAGLCSSTAILTGIDSGSDIKVICPIQTGGMAMVFPPENPLRGWEAVKDFIQNSERPIMVGYHSAVSGPRILIESILRGEGFYVTEDPNEVNADVLMVDLKAPNNLIPSLMSNQVDCWVGPTAYPEIAEARGVGVIAMVLEEFPPKGMWTNFPCCVYSVREEVLNKYPEVFRAFARLIHETCEYAMENREDAALIFAEVVGVDQETTERSTIKYTTNPDENWLKGMGVYVEGLNRLEKFTGRLKEQPFEAVAEKAFDFSHIRQVRGD